MARDAAGGVGGVEEERGVTLLAALHAFFQEHERCGDLDSAVEDDRIWNACTCGAVINRCVHDD